MAFSLVLHGAALRLLCHAVPSVLQHMLDSAGCWGRMEAQRWEGFLDWLSTSGLLTTNIQSRSDKVRGSSHHVGRFVGC